MVLLLRWLVRLSPGECFLSFWICVDRVALERFKSRPRRTVASDEPRRLRRLIRLSSRRLDGEISGDARHRRAAHRHSHDAARVLRVSVPQTLESGERHREDGGRHRRCRSASSRRSHDGKAGHQSSEDGSATSRWSGRGHL